MEDRYDPKKIVENSNKYLHQTIAEARKILSEKASRLRLLDLDFLLIYMSGWSLFNNSSLLNYLEAKFRANKIDEKSYYADQIIHHMLSNYFMAGIVKGIGEYAKKLDPKDPKYDEKDRYIKYFIYNLDVDPLHKIYEDFLDKVIKEMKSKSKEKYSLKDYDDILREVSNDLANKVEKLVEDPYKILLENRSFYKHKPIN
jgi:hypothetical protein